MTGYAHSQYAASLAEWGTPRDLSGCGGWLLERDIAGSGSRDGCGCYPFFSCRDWSMLKADLDQITHDLVSLTLVTDPLAETNVAELRQTFPHKMDHFKDHLIVELGPSPETFVHSHHLRNARQASQRVRVYQGEPSEALLQKWIELYGHLIERHQIRGISAFSAVSFATQFQVPGLVVQWAEAGGEIIGMVLWYVQGERAYYHLGAYHPTGYSMKCSYALFLAAIEHFAASGVRWLGLGAGAGAANDGTDGLTRFKQGWSNATRPVYLCGRIYNPDRYQALCQSCQVGETSYFPAYRKGELA